MSDKNNIKSFLNKPKSSGEYKSFDISEGFYEIEYATSLHINYDNKAERMIIGNNPSKKDCFRGYIDEFKVLSEPYEDFRASAIPVNSSRNITSEYLDPSPQCPDLNTNLLLPFDDPRFFQIRELRRKKFFDSNTNFTFSLNKKEVESLSENLNNEEEFVSKMINMGFGMDIAERTYQEVHKANGGPISNIARYYPNSEHSLPLSSSGPNNRFSGSARFVDGHNIGMSDPLESFRPNRFTIEFWISPEVDTYLDNNNRVFFDSRSIFKVIKKASFNKEIKMSDGVEQVLSVRLLSNTHNRQLERYYDEVYIDKISGKLTGGGGVGRDYSEGCTLKNNGKTIILKEPLPKSDIFVEVVYIPKGSNKSFVKISKTDYGTAKVEISDGVNSQSIEKDIRWIKNSWHRIVAQYNRSERLFEAFIDGEHIISKSSKFINLPNLLGSLTIGSDYTGFYTANSKISNFRISEIIRYKLKNSLGAVIDPGYSKNISLCTPIEKDEDTLLFINFENKKTIDYNTAVLYNPKSSIYKFNVNISDNFDELSDEIKYELLLDLVNRLKPAHTNVKINTHNRRC